ncbi:MAG: hypothetical protein PHY27_14710 [Parabacteroides sp.]|jgi:NAD-dependent SIR2 family protein deacetylase|nr:hypothetical protein [Parabacteroides sp.]
MAEFCLKCFNKLNDTNYQEKDVVLEDDLCEGCAEIKPCIVTFKSRLGKQRKGLALLLIMAAGIVIAIKVLCH